MPSPALSPASLPNTPNLALGRQGSLFLQQSPPIPHISPNITIKDATSQDAAVINDLLNETIRERTFLEWKCERPLSERQWYLDCCLKNGYPVLVAFDGKEPIAFGALEHGVVDPTGDSECSSYDRFPGPS